MARYAKGANAERELIRFFSEKGFAVLRAAGSGVSQLPSPDILVLKNGRMIAIECKAWNQDYLSIPVGQMNEVVEWSNTAGSDVFIAWRMPRKHWFFLKPGHFNKNERFFVISRKNAEKKGFSFDAIAALQGVSAQKK